jgi:hypothetical protein
MICYKAIPAIRGSSRARCNVQETGEGVPGTKCQDRRPCSYALAMMTGGKISIGFFFFFAGVPFSLRGVSGPVPIGVAAGESAGNSSSSTAGKVPNAEVALGLAAAFFFEVAAADDGLTICPRGPILV